MDFRIAALSPAAQVVVSEVNFHEDFVLQNGMITI